MVRHWRYIMEGTIPPALLAEYGGRVEPKMPIGVRMEAYIRAMVSWNDSCLPFVRGARVELVNLDEQFPPIRLE